jgi:6-phosphogluconate dehydrogenase
MVTWRRDPNLVTLLLDEAFRAIIGPRQESWRSIAQTAVGLRIPARP